MSAPSPPPTTQPSPAHNRGWIWFFVFLIVASAGVAGLMIWFNRSIQLTPEQLQSARQLWQQQGPRDYQMEYTTQIDHARADRFLVKVRDGQVQEVLMNGKPLETEEGRDPRPYHRMEQLFSYIQRNLELDSKPGQPKVYAVAIFDDQTGALRRYIRSVMSTTKRLEMNVTVSALTKG